MSAQLLQDAKRPQQDDSDKSGREEIGGQKKNDSDKSGSEESESQLIGEGGVPPKCVVCGEPYCQREHSVWMYASEAYN